MARDVPAGQLIGEPDVRVAELGLAPGVATVGVQDRGRVVGRVASSPLAAGQVLDPAAVADPLPIEAGQVLMSLAVAPEHAAAGTLRAGDLVAVVASSPPDQPTAGRAGLLLSPVRVVSVSATTDETGADGKLLVSLAVAGSRRWRWRRPPTAPWTWCCCHGQTARAVRLVLSSAHAEVWELG